MRVPTAKSAPLRANFLTEGDILDNADGTITLFPNRREANLVTFRFGVTIGVGN